MKRNVKIVIVICIVLPIVSFLLILWARLPKNPTSKTPAPKKVSVSIEVGTSYLEKLQAEDGSIGKNAGVTALAVIGMQGAALDKADPYIRNGVAYILSRVGEDGAIDDEGGQSYNTALGLIALKSTGNPEYDRVVKKAMDFLVRLQNDEGEGLLRDNVSYGGIGYGRRGPERPDLSNTQFALEALKTADLPEEAENWDKAIKFLERCQNLSETNDQPWAGDDGGFIYLPGVSNAGGTRSYGSMTCAGLISFLYCGLSKDDPRVQAAYDWLSNHYTLEGNPNMGKQGLYYYYLMLAKSLSAYGDRIIIDKYKRKHFWADELTNKLFSLQHPEGYWVNSDSKWWEDNKALVTAYCLIALKECKPFLTKFIGQEKQHSESWR